MERSGDIAEIQGLYGSFSFPEKLLQKIWLRRDFDHTKARTMDGRRVRITFPGRWNLLGGPDFRQARIRFDDGAEIVGDVELHLRADDWDAHAHARDTAYDDVILHVVLFQPEPRHATIGRDGRRIPVVSLLPLLHHDLEEYATDDAVESLSNRPTARFANELAVFPREELLRVLKQHASNRWMQKLRFARVRLNALGWTDACHHGALEVLGFRYNRSPMLRIASRRPLPSWTERRVEIGELLATEADSWSLQGVRPANHPRTRLRQYAAWTAANADWPAALLEASAGLPRPAPGRPTRAVRRELGMSDLRGRIAAQVCGEAVGGRRLDNLVCDAFLPLLGAHLGTGDLGGLWFHWFSGDIPSFVTTGLRQVGVLDGRGQPACHGLAQGLLDWLIQHQEQGDTSRD